MSPGPCLWDGARVPHASDCPAAGGGLGECAGAGSVVVLAAEAPEPEVGNEAPRANAATMQCAHRTSTEPGAETICGASANRAFARCRICQGVLFARCDEHGGAAQVARLRRDHEDECARVHWVCERCLNASVNRELGQSVCESCRALAEGCEHGARRLVGGRLVCEDCGDVGQCCRSYPSAAPARGTRWVLTCASSGPEVPHSDECPWRKP